MSGGHKPHMLNHHHLKTSSFGIPLQFILGVLSFLAGTFLILDKMGMYYQNYVQQELLIYICSVSSVIGGLHMVLSKLSTPRIYV